MTELNLLNAFKALSLPIRLRIAVLLTEGELCVCKITEILQLPQSTVSRHLAILKNHKMILDRRDRKWNHYCLATYDNEAYEELFKLLKKLKNQSPHKEDLQKLKGLKNIEMYRDC